MSAHPVLRPVTDLVIPDPINRAEFAAAAFLARYRVHSTRQGYAAALRGWFQFCADHFVDPLAAQRAHIELWARSLEASGLKQSSVATKLTAVAGYYRLAVADGVIDRDPSTHVRRPVIPRESTTNGLSRSEFADMLAAAKRSSLQDYALIRLLGVAGMRVGETCGIDIEHLDRYEGQMVVHLNRKGDKQMPLPIEARTAWVIEQLIDGRTDDGPVFRSRVGNRMDKKAAGRVVKRLAEQAGITKRVHPHVLRHTFVTLARNGGVPDREILAVTGHKDGRMIDYYDRAAKIELARNGLATVSTLVERLT